MHWEGSITAEIPCIHIFSFYFTNHNSSSGKLRLGIPCCKCSGIVQWLSLNLLVQPLAAGFARYLCFELLMLDSRPYRAHAQGFLPAIRAYPQVCGETPSPISHSYLKIYHFDFSGLSVGVDSTRAASSSTRRVSITHLIHPSPFELLI